MSRQLFAERCSACHVVDANKAGPMLGGVIDRRAGSAPGYNYSLALRGADLTWSVDNLDRWLADPSKFIAGAKMPISILDASTRRDVIAYLQIESSKSSDRSKFGPVVQSASDQPRKK
jgi:cytochrome c2